MILSEYGHPRSKRNVPSTPHAATVLRQPETHAQTLQSWVPEYARRPEDTESEPIDFDTHASTG